MLPAAADWSCRLQRYAAAAYTCDNQALQYGMLWISDLSQGSGSLDFTALQLEPGLALFWAPGQIRRLQLQAFSGWELTFGLDTFCQSGLDDRMLASLGLFAPLAASPLLRIPAAAATELEPIWETWAREQPSQAFFRQLTATYLRLVLLRCGRLAGSRPVEAAEAGVWPAFRQLLEARFRSWHQVADYADALALTPDHLNQIVRQASGRAAKQLIQERLMLEARRAAWFSQASLKTIAYELGFSDPAYFSRLFRRCSGQTFSDFREQIRRMD